MLSYWIMLAIFFGVAAICCIMGFKKFVWFLSVGYGFAICGLGVAYFVVSLTSKTFNVVTLLQCILFVAYGLRLGLFTLIRELKNASYRKVLASATKENEKPMPVFVKATIWIFVAALYVIQTSPVFDRIYGAANGIAQNAVLGYVGIGISVLGLVLEALADAQKSAQKKENPHMVATKGLYKMCRCPNYLGEILFWTGVFVGGIMTYVSAPNAVCEWILAVIGYVCIVYIMVNGAQRLDRRQEKNYGTSEEYRAYADHTPIILPLIPVSHIGKYKEEESK